MFYILWLIFQGDDFYLLCKSVLCTQSPLWIRYESPLTGVLLDSHGKTPFFTLHALM